MDQNDKIRHYQVIRRAKAGILPDGRSKLGRSLVCFRRWLREPYGDNWNSLQDAREAVGIPVVVFYLACPIVNERGELLKDFKWAHNALERLIRDIADLGDKAANKTKVPTLQEWIQSQEGKK